MVHQRPRLNCRRRHCNDEGWAGVTGCQGSRAGNQALTHSSFVLPHWRILLYLSAVYL